MTTLNVTLKRSPRSLIVGDHTIAIEFARPEGEANTPADGVQTHSSSLKQVDSPSNARQTSSMTRSADAGRVSSGIPTATTPTGMTASPAMPKSTASITADPSGKVVTPLSQSNAVPILSGATHEVVTAADLGFRQKSIAAQAAFIARPEPGEIRSRPTIRVANPRDGVPRHGMFLATGAASEATRYAQVAFNDRGVKGSFATSATLAGAVGKCLFSKANAFDPNRFDRPFPITVRADGETLCSGMQLLALATTLDKLILGTRPFWGGKSGPLRVTTFPYPLPCIPRWFLPAIIGGEDRTSPPGARTRPRADA